MNPLQVKQALTGFLNEDLGFGDLSTALLPQQTIQGDFIAKEAGIICGQTLPQQVYDLLGSAHYEALIPEGQAVVPGDHIGRVQGDTATLLSGERVILNLMQRQSGIATATAQAVATLKDPTIKIVDTRKTMPGLRLFDKYAVTVGGGVNHRLGLDHGVMLKDNHIAAAGSITAAVAAVKQQAGPMLRIEVEVETKAQVQEAVAAKADVIMFDNQTPETVAQWQKLVPETIYTEASGGIYLANLATYRGCGVNFISLGYLTNAALPLDISFILKGAVKA
ncbi:nicotinate-nucleotide pyrophosphorylase [Agrilactobacillus composti DSM 18527 = JCM 14202]|uniref:Probable nicotinate-nucleotide pyrophosphorylase [carboxylating] n=1 Tax=Agrilactobacillus composti DSM 18527 = JCM 14202 TaxID=1423734 RepID=X0PCR8_9LACO|nr:carboxylating nicotinate-nucleotide diphosphorylase [Agrilactobacillus composti]KRM30564.1 nicotinate-nucleotide pyrophosphorylase [Agrilactobacillus composti DSM 18527 = JCM 14202]GAF38363.1 quinolinate phosphoribosyltransferase [Agrilactobacillus composti DSM 18527 = JCM 14202]